MERVTGGTVGKNAAGFFRETEGTRPLLLNHANVIWRVMVGKSSTLHEKEESERME